MDVAMCSFIAGYRLFFSTNLSMVRPNFVGEIKQDIKRLGMSPSMRGEIVVFCLFVSSIVDV